MMEERQVDVQAATDGIRQFLNAWGIDLEKTGMADTPMRVVEAYGEFFSGLNRTDEDLWKNPIQTDTTGIVALRNLEYYSLCEHHLLPFFGTVSIAYLPKNGKIAGFGRFADAVAAYARRPQLQERMTEELCQSIEKGLDTAGVLVMVRGRHLCLSMRNPLAGKSEIMTVAARGALEAGSSLYERALKLLEEHGDE